MVIFQSDGPSDTTHDPQIIGQIQVRCSHGILSLNHPVQGIHPNRVNLFDFYDLQRNYPILPSWLEWGRVGWK